MKIDKKTYIQQVEHMVVNPYYEGELLEGYEFLNECLHDKIPEEMLLDKCLRYCAFVFDPNSPLVKQYTDIRERRKQAANETGYKGGGDRLLEANMLRKVYRSKTWSLICCIDDVYDEYITKVKEVIQMDEPDKALKAVELKSTLLENMRAMLKDRKELVDEFYGGDKEIEEVDNEITPEKRARMKR